MDSLIFQGETTALITEANVTSSPKLLCDKMLFWCNRIMKAAYEFSVHVHIILFYHEHSKYCQITYLFISWNTAALHYPSIRVDHHLWSHDCSSILSSQLQLQVNLTECHQPLNDLMSYSIVYSKSQSDKSSCIVYCIHLLFSLFHIMIVTDSKSYVKPCV